MTAQKIDEQITSLKREILTMEWDLPIIRNSELKSGKEMKLQKFRAELYDLTRQRDLSRR